MATGILIHKCVIEVGSRATISCYPIRERGEIIILRNKP